MTAECVICDTKIGDTARHYCKVTYTIPEAKYNTAPPDVQAALSEARTVFLQGVSVSIEEDDDA